jgi:hypothetical protein
MTPSSDFGASGGTPSGGAPSVLAHTVVATPAMRRWQVGLVASGVLLLALGGLVLVLDVGPSEFVGIAIWFAGAIILHDGILAPIVFGVSLLLRRAGKRISLGALLIVQGAVVVGAMVALLAVPQQLKQAIGTANPTILPLNYGVNLVVFGAVLIAVTVLAVVVYLRRVRARS